MATNNKSGKRATEPPSRGLDRRHLGFFGLGVLLTLLLGAGVFYWHRGDAGPAAVAQPAPMVSRGPWGQLTYTSIELERPDESLVNDGKPVPPTTWFFENRTPRQVLDLFLTNRLSGAQLSQLTNQATWRAISNGWLLLPSPELVRSLDPAVRQTIYAELKGSPRNPFHHHPFAIAPEKLEHWLGESRLPQDKQALFKSLTYPARGRVCFSDYEVMESLCSVDERKCLARAISQTPALLMKLRVGPESDLEGLVGYWGRGERGRLMKPLLRALARTPGGSEVSVSFFFPAFARLRLYTYPDPATDPAALQEDCFWTALNFGNDTPDNRFFEETQIRQTLKNDYYPVSTNFVFGDLVVLLDDRGGAIHICVYVADEVVFTKNGVDPFSPWVLMRIPDMLARYQSETGQRIELTAVRRKPDPPPAPSPAPGK